MVAAPSFWGAGGVAGASLAISATGPAAGPGPSALRLAGAGGEEISPSGAPAGPSPAAGEEAECFGASATEGAVADAFGVAAVGGLAEGTEAFGDGEAEGVAEGASAANAPTTATKISARTRAWRAIVIYFCFGFDKKNKNKVGFYKVLQYFSIKTIKRNTAQV